MSTISNFKLTTVLIFSLLFIRTNLIAQEINQSNISALCHNGLVSIRTSIFIASQWPSPPVVNFYFGPNDPRNGEYTPSSVSLQGLFHIIISFPIPCLENENLSFVMNIDFGQGPISFVNGEYCDQCVSDFVEVCPSSLECQEDPFINFYMNYGAETPIELFINEEFSFFFGPGHPGNTTVSVHGWNDQTHSLAVRFFPGCEEDGELPEQVTLMVDGEQCYYENGHLVEHFMCSPWSDYYQGDAGVCMDFFENCLPEFMLLLDEIGPMVPCRNWVEIDEDCSTNRVIYRTGRVRIGSSGASNLANINLAVTRGIITDKLTVQSCDVGGWCDYVFDQGYNLLPLEEVEQHIETCGHLHNTPSAEEIAASEGIYVKATTMNQQEKIEEIFLHLIKMQKEADKLMEEYEALSAEHERLKNVAMEKSTEK